MKNILYVLLIAIAFTGCYDDSYLDAKLDQTSAYFASKVDYTRTLVVGEGMRFKIGAAMAGDISNSEDRTVEFKVLQDGVTFDDGLRQLMPITHYNAADLSGSVQAIISKGEFFGYFDIEIDSTKFLGDPLTLDGVYTLPVKIMSTSLDKVGEVDSVNISVSYIAGVDGYYLYESVIKKELNGNIIEEKTEEEKFINETDANTWRFKTIAPFQVELTSATTSFSSGLKFNMTVKDGNISVESIEGQPVVELEGENIYNSSTRDFDINFKYQQASNDTIYHVNTQLMFRNRLRDGVNETREYLYLLEN